MTIPEVSSGQASLPTPNSTKSFWHTEPSQVLLGHRTTPSLPGTADIVIIGSGISGTSAAHSLKQDEAGKKLSVVMLEAREACWGATGRNGGHCQPLIYANPPDVAAFEMRNYDTIKAFVAKNKIQCDWKSLPSCHSYKTEDMFKIAAQQAKNLADADAELGKLITVVSKDSTNPSLHDLRIPNSSGAIVTAKAASLWPYKYVAWLLEHLLSTSEGSFNLQTNTPVTKLQKVDDGSWIVHTERGMIATKKILLTTNAYTSHLLPAFSDLIVPVRGEMSSLIPPKSMRPATINEPLTHSYSFMGHATQNIDQDDYLVQRPFSPTMSGGELMFGGGRNFAVKGGIGVSDDSSIDPPAAAYLRRELNVMLDLQNHDDELEASCEWSGIMGFSRDGRPWVGEVSESFGGGKGLWVCAGFTGHGMPNTGLSGKAVIDMILGNEVDLPESYKFSEERVVKARTFDEVAIADAKAGNIDVRERI
ncbi:putative FAD dependent oxidoreductase protein [Coleophoma crateriformis]|uniref:Putative FAD dependent oxidoreductase protein n=1 Tax=Coleophoma crateriformis TaxID=565419 RepID=A0A3D8T111_9HELO|nr:putative FAD dependent oxidoreductase protein [Coleophoma crateriformis]